MINADDVNGAVKNADYVTTAKNDAPPTDPEFNEERVDVYAAMETRLGDKPAPRFI